VKAILGRDLDGSRKVTAQNGVDDFLRDALVVLLEGLDGASHRDLDAQTAVIGIVVRAFDLTSGFMTLGSLDTYLCQTTLRVELIVSDIPGRNKFHVTVEGFLARGTVVDDLDLVASLAKDLDGADITLILFDAVGDLDRLGIDIRHIVYVN